MMGKLDEHFEEEEKEKKNRRIVQGRDDVVKRITLYCLVRSVI